MKDKKWLSLFTILILIISLFTVIGCSKDDNNSDSSANGDIVEKKVPVYTGMTVSNKDIARVVNSNIVEDILDELDYDGDYFGKNDDIDDNDPFGDDEEVDDVVDTSINVEGALEKMYYANSNDDIFITIHIDNPDDFEILSFTLNGKKYTNYMFENGSDMENIILKYNVGDTRGIQSYTIDAIKYVDGEDIKDVILKGDKTVKVGVYDSSLVVASITNEVISTNSISFEVQVDDETKLIGNEPNALQAVLYDGEVIVESKNIKVGQNKVTFDNLATNKLYQYGIIGYFDNLDGEGVAMNMLFKKAFNTEAVVLFDNINVGYEDITFDYAWNSKITNHNIIKLELKDMTTSNIVTYDKNIKSIDNLYSNHRYSLVASYMNKDKIENISIIFTTQPKRLPSIDITSFEVAKTNILAIYDVVDVNNVVLSKKSELYENGSLIDSNNEGIVDFKNIKTDTKYQVKIIISYDLNDGNGVNTLLYTKECTTYPEINVTSVKISNTSAVSEGETIYMQAMLDNLSDVKVDKVSVNGVAYNVLNTSTANRIFVEIIYNGQFEGGNTKLSIDGIYGQHKGRDIIVKDIAPNEASVFINGRIELDRACFVDETYNDIEWKYNSTNAYGAIRLHNKTGYIIDSILIDKQKGNGIFDADVLVTDLTKISDELYIFPYDRWNVGGHTTRFTLKEIKYHNEYKSGTITLQLEEAYCYNMLDNSAKLIHNAEELMAIQSGNYYELANDIDLSGIEWKGVKFAGVIDGKGYSIRNMSYVGTMKSNDVTWALFNSFAGTIKNLHLKDVTCIMTIDPPSGDTRVSVAGFVANTKLSYEALPYDNNTLNVINCSIDSNSIISVTNKSANTGNMRVAGFVSDMPICNGSFETCIDSCVNEASITAKNDVERLENAPDGFIVSGIISDIDGNQKVINCVNRGNISSSVGYSAGIIGSNQSYRVENILIENCTNYGNIDILKDICFNAAGISLGIYNTSKAVIRNVVNNGNITSVENTKTSYVAGIVNDIANVNEVILDSCINNGNLQGGRVAGLILYLRNSHCTMNNLVNNGDMVANNDCAGVVLRAEDVSLYNVTNKGNITSKGYYNAGITLNAKEIIGAINEGNITVEDTAGGIYGCSGVCNKIENCINRGDISGGVVGGIMPEQNSSLNMIVSKCQNYGTIKVITKGEYMYAGGIAGKIVTAMIVEDCINYGKIESLEEIESMAGISGIANVVAKNNVVIRRCINVGNINQYVICAAGIMNYVNYNDIFEGELYDCVNLGQLTHPVLPNIAESVYDRATGGIAISIDKDRNIAYKNCYSNKKYVEYDMVMDKANLNNMYFYRNTLHFDDSVWNLSDLDIDNGHYPKLR